MTGQNKMKFHKTSVNIASDVYDVLSHEAKKMNIPFTSMLNMLLTKESVRILQINKERTNYE